MKTPSDVSPADFRVFRSGRGRHLFIADGSRIYDLPPPAAQPPASPSASGEHADDEELLEAVGTLLAGPRRVTESPPAPPPLHSISLNVAQSCNMGCHYCYADGGRFNGPARAMCREVAEAAIDRLITESEVGASLLLGFMGGEPLLNRALVRHATAYAARAASLSGRQMRFSITTNATLMTAEDVRLFNEYPFTVQVSIDGAREQNDDARPMNGGASSYDGVLAALRLMERWGRPRLLAARATVTPRTGELLPILDHLLSLGFDDVGFAAVLVSPSPEYAFGADDFPPFLERMIACGTKALAELSAGRPYAFGNLETALAEIHRGTHRPYPCGAGAAYLSANAEGRLFACHRLIDDERFAMGDVRSGPDLAARSAHLALNHVDRSEPCRSCWARYLCGGGCYHEVSRRGRVGCDYIRGWLDFCLRAYVELQSARPDYFNASPDPERATIGSANTLAS